MTRKKTALLPKIHSMNIFAVRLFCFKESLDMEVHRLSGLRYVTRERMCEGVWVEERKPNVSVNIMVGVGFRLRSTQPA